MSEWKSVDEVLDFAISNEEAATRLYRELATKAGSDQMRKALEGFAREEQGHKAKLLEVKKVGGMQASTEKVLDLKIADYLVDVAPGADLGYQEILIVAMKQEKAAFKLYSDLAEAADNEQLRDLLLALAQEEAKHKLRFEIEYDEGVYTED